MNFKRVQAYLALVGVTLCWGITFPLIRTSLQVLTPSQFVLLRFGSALLCLLPFSFRRLRGLLTLEGRALFAKGCGLGAISWVSYHAQTLGLRTVEGGRAAFITGLSVVIVPFLSPLFGSTRPKKLDVLAAAGALTGLYFLTDPATQSISTGDLWVLLCAFAYATYVWTVKLWVLEGSDVFILSFSQIFGIFLCSFLASQAESIPFPVLSWQVALAVGICSLFATILVTVLQVKFQPKVTAEKAALIFSLESVFAAIFGFILLGETLSPRGMFGCAIIFGAVIVSELLRSYQQKAPHAV